MNIATLCILRDIDGLTKVSLTDDYEIQLEPLTASNNSFSGYLLNAWKELADADLTNHLTFDLVGLVLKNTYPVQANPNSLPGLLEAAREPVKPKSTAANPRAFKGTKHQPPKAPTQKSINLRPYLNSLQGIQQLILLNDSLKKEFPENSDPGQIEYLSMPVDFRISFYQLLRDQSASLIKKFLRLYFDLGLDQDTSLKKLCLRFLHKTSPYEAFGFLNHLQKANTENRIEILKQIFSELYLKDLTKQNHRLNETLDLAIEFAEFSSLEKTWTLVLSGIRNEASYELMKFTLELHRDFHQYFIDEADFNYLYLKKTQLPLCCTHEIRNLLEYYSNFKDLKKFEQFGLRHAIMLAEYCASSSENQKSFLTIAWKDIPAYAASRFVFGLNLKKWPSKSTLVIAQFLAKHKGGAKAQSLLNALEDLRDDDIISNENFPEFLSWLFKIEELDHACEAYYGDLATILYKGLHGKNKQRVLELPEQCFQQIFKACLRSNDANLISNAIKTIVQLAPEFTLDALEKSPKALMKTLKSMGCLNKSLREAVFKRFTKDPIFALKPAPEKNQNEQRHLLKILIDSACAISIPQKIRIALTQNDDIAPDLLQRAVNEVTPHLLKSKLEFLEKLSLDSMSNRDIMKMHNKVRHAFKILHQNNHEPNARAFKKFLSHYLDGDINYLVNHERNQIWLKKNDCINFEPWLEGFQRRYHLGNDKTTFTIKIELDPLEALKHGTYAGTCTGIGGNYSWSALGTVLDINKKVVYAFNDRNQIICRQIVAVSKDRELVCYAIYPEETKKEVKQLFAQYDKALAEAMGIKVAELYADYAIESILTTYWWDDFQFQDDTEDSEDKDLDSD